MTTFALEGLQVEELMRRIRSGICSKCGAKMHVSVPVNTLPPFKESGESMYVGKEADFDGFRCRGCDNVDVVAKGSALVFMGQGSDGKVSCRLRPEHILDKKEKLPDEPS
jgi:hypothetical protein